MESRSNQFPPKIQCVLSGASALAFYAGCVLMPLAGRAGASAPHAGANRLALTLVWAIGTAAGLAVWRGAGKDHSRRFRRGAAALAGTQALLLVLLWTGPLAR
jgi:hypothetical protein